jgi:short-subunit dehydrogenase
MSLKYQRILVTGGSGGIGRLLVGEFLREGAEVTVMSRSNNVPKGSAHVQVELSTLDGIVAAEAAVVREEPDILVNMAGIQYFGCVEDQGSEELFKSYLVNLFAPVSLCRASLPAMKRRNSGQIVNIGSVLGSVPLAHFAVYSSAKAGLRAFSEALRRELVGTRVYVTHVSPRATRTKLMTPAIQKYAQITGMTIDEPLEVARSIFAGIKQRRKELCIGIPERVFARINAVLPGLVDAAVARKDRLSKILFSSMLEGASDGKAP